MRAVLVIVAALALVAFLPAPAEAQITRSSLTITLQAPDRAFTHNEEMVTVPGTTTFVGDIGQYLNTNGIPISYTVTKQPAWLTVTVSPSSDIIPLPPFPSGPTVVMSRAFTVTMILLADYEGETTDVVEIAVEQGASFGGIPASAKTAVPVMVDAELDEPCPEGAHADLTALALQAAEAYDKEQAQMREDDTTTTSSEGDEVTVQNATASPVSLPWIAVAGFALVGAGVGLALRRRFAR